MSERPTALIGGASSGIGAALANELAKRGHDLVLVARRQDRLDEVARQCREEHDVEATAFVQDLARADGAPDLLDWLGERDCAPEVLVNNAAFSVHGAFAATPLDDELALNELQLGAMIRLTKGLLPQMIARRRGWILNVSSIYAFLPVAHQAVYAAGKAFMLSFSEALARELAGTGVSVTSLCPGLTRTPFRERSGIADAPSRWAMEPEAVARSGCDGLFAGRPRVVPGLVNRALVFGARHLPLRLTAAFTRRINRRRGLDGGSS